MLELFERIHKCLFGKIREAALRQSESSVCFWGVRRLCGARGRGREQDCRSKGRIRRRREAGASREILMLLHKNALGDDDDKDRDPVSKIKLSSLQWYCLPDML